MPLTDAQRAQLQSIATKAGLALTTGATGSAKARGYALRDSVLTNFAAWTAQFEGYTPFMYTDVKGYVTTGIGNLIDPKPAAMGLPWKNADGSAASQSDISSAWDTVKAAWPGTQSMACAKLTSIRLDKDGIRQLVESKLLSNDQYLAAHFPGYASWPADAQLALNSMAWAMGPGFNFPSLKASLAETPPNFKSAALVCGISTKGNPGVIPRNYADQLLFENAAAVVSGQGNPDTLYYLTPPGSMGGGSNPPSSGGGPSSGFTPGDLLWLAIPIGLGLLAAGIAGRNG